LSTLVLLLSACSPPLPHNSLQRTNAEQTNSAMPRDLEKPTSYPHGDTVNVSPEIAERRADLGKDASLGQIQAFDGPAPETINGEGRHALPQHSMRLWVDVAACP
jgi:hypothetical protein